MCDSEVGFPTHIPNTTSGQSGEATPPTPTVVHLSIRPCPPAGSKDTPKKKSMRRSGGMADEGQEAGGQGCCSKCKSSDLEDRLAESQVTVQTS